MKRIFQVFTTLFVVLIMTGNTYANEGIGNDIYTFPDSINIHEAAKKGSLEEVKAFLNNGENVDVKDKHGMTPLYYAAVNGHKNVCEYLISQGADVDAGSEFGFFPLGGIINTPN